MNDITALAQRMKQQATLANGFLYVETSNVLALVEALEKEVAMREQNLSIKLHMSERIAKLEESRNKLREGMAAIYNAICADGASTSLSAILTFVKRAHEESAAAGIQVIEGGE